MIGITRLTEAAQDRDEVMRRLCELQMDLHYLDSCDDAECAASTQQAYELLKQAACRLNDAREVVSRLGREASRKGG